MTLRPPCRSLHVLALPLLAGILLAGCSDDGDDGLASGTVTLELSHVVSGVPLAYNTIVYTNAAGDQYSVETLFYYVSRVLLTRPDGSDYTTSVVHYCDAAEPGTQTLELRDVPPGEYDGLVFIFGLNDVDNVTDGLPATPENINMAWPEPMGGGYHYMKLEGKFIRTGETQERTYRTHTGRNMMTPHYIPMAFTFDDPITVDGNSWEVTLVMDLNEWYQNPHVYAFPDSAMMMGDMELQNRPQANGADVFTLGPVLMNP